MTASDEHWIDMTDEPIANWNNEDNVFNGRLPNWYGKAACYGASGDLFFEEGVRSLVIEAKRFCISCPVRIECLQFAYTNDEIGIWGGLTTKERRSEWRRRIRTNGAPK